MLVPLVHHPHYVAPLPDGHRFPMTKYAALWHRLEQTGLARADNTYRCEPAPRAWLELAHDPGYVARVLDRTLPREDARRIGFEITERVVKRTRLSAAGTALAARLALEHGLACQTAGGSHHGHPAFGSGFCVFNDVGVAASLIRAEGLVDRVLIIDLDVHQGDGTAAIFADEPAVFTFSLHAEKNFPVRKVAGDLDIGLPDATGDEPYLATLERYLDPLIDHHRPDIVFYNAGVDPHHEDRLGRLGLSAEGLKRRDARVIAAAQQRDIPLVTVVGGGYRRDLDGLAALHAQVIETALGSPSNLASHPLPC